MTLPESFFISPEIHAREIELPDGKKHTLYFRELSAAEWSRYSRESKSKDVAISDNAIPRIIAAGLCTESGETVMDPARAATLKGPVMNRMFDALVKLSSGEDLGK